MIENHRDEDLCRRWDALADEDHTHHLTAQEYLHYKSKWWLHSNKQGSNTMSLRHRPDFKQALSTLQRLQQEAGEEPQVPTYYNKNNINGKHAVHLLHGGIGKVHGGLLITPKVNTEMHQVSSERGDLLLAVFGKILRKKTFMNSITLLQIDRSQPTAVYCNRRWCKHNTSNDPFSRCKCAIIGYRKELTITEYSLTTSTKVNYKVQKERNLHSALRLRGDTENDTNDNVTTKTQNTFNTAHMNTGT